MPILGLVVVAQDEDARAALTTTLIADSRITVAKPVGLRIPIVLDVRSREEEQAYWRALESLDGVVHVEVAFAAVDDEDEEKGGQRATS